jgi:hypothetical protein
MFEIFLRIYNHYVQVGFDGTIRKPKIPGNEERIR